MSGGRALRAEETSDVTRFRGVLLAALAGAAVAAGGVAISAPRRAAPGPLARPHVRAGLSCRSCHGEEPAARACAGCHPDHASTRAPHSALIARGELGCPDCHRIHRQNSGVAFAGGDAWRYGPGAERAIEPPRGFHSSSAITVPLVAAAACERCHALDSPRDPAAACLVAGQEALGGRRPTVCFDEHRAAGNTRRAAAWEAAREVAAAAPLAPAAAAPPLRPGGWLGLGLLVALVFWGAGRAAPKLARRRRTEPEPEPPRPPATRRLPVIDTATCLGCHACVDACPFDVLEIERFVAVVSRPDDCCGLTLCEQRCPNQSLVMVAGGEAEPGRRAAIDIDESLESRVKGLYLAGDITGLPLIRNAINQGALAARAVWRDLERSGRSGDAELDLVIVGAGPAGISAALEAEARGLSYQVLEQSSVAASIKSFPRGKLVFDQPLELPLVGDLWLEESTKEELLARWLRIVRERRLCIREGARVAAIERRGDGFAVAIAGAASELCARRVLVAIGRRGSPRRLAAPVPPAFEAHVHYSLADARSFAGKRVLVVGLGDVAMEAAVALSRQAGTRVTVSYRGDRFRRGKARNISELERRVAAGAVELLWRTEVAAVEPGRALLEAPDGRRAIDCDAIFVLIGSIPTYDLLDRIGVSGAEQGETQP